MKIVLTGSTGFIGREILTQCIAHHYISHIYVLTRRPLDAQYAHKKVSQILREDFNTYPEALLQRLRDEGAEACIWALGGRIERFRDLEEARKVGVNYPVAAAEALEKGVARSWEPYEGYPERPPAAHERLPFRFVFLSAWGAEQDQFRSLWLFNDSRKIKGAAEKALFAVVANAEEKAGEHKCFQVIALRPGAVLKGGSDSMTTVITEAVVPSIAVGRLARTAIKVAFSGANGETILENRECLGDDWAEVNSLTF